MTSIALSRLQSCGARLIEQTSISTLNILRLAEYSTPAQKIPFAPLY
jgi:hypothetical protein